MKIVFFGSDDFAEFYLRALLDSPHQVVACVTQPDRPKDRGMKITVSPIKKIAQMRGIPVLQPEQLKNNNEFLESLKEFCADVFVVISYGRFLTSEILLLAPLGALNVHGSLLPKYRGAAPINWAIMNGETETGVTIFRLNAGMDAGEILIQEKITISDQMTSIDLRQAMMPIGARLLRVTLDRLAEMIPGTVQDESKATFAPKLTKEMGHIDWYQPVRTIHNLVRGLLPWPSAHTFINGKMVKILKTNIWDGSQCLSAGKAGLSQISDQPASSAPGEILQIDESGIAVLTGDGILLVQQVQPEGKKVMDAASFARGQRTLKILS